MVPNYNGPRVTSAALNLNVGRTSSSVEVSIINLRDIRSVADAILHCILTHGARWVGGFNNVGFDNKFFENWCSSDYECMLTRVAGGYKIDTPKSATYDLYLHVTRFHSGEYRRDNLDTIATTDLHMGKLDVGVGAFNVQNMAQYHDPGQVMQTIRYCITDSAVRGSVFIMDRPSMPRGYMGELKDLCVHLQVWPSLICS